MKTSKCSLASDVCLSGAAAICAIFAIPSQSAVAQPQWQFAFPTNSMAFYQGALDEKTVGHFIDAAKTRNIRTLVITSPGGSIAAGVALGQWVYEHQVDIEIDRVCASACANYVFPAGKTKTIRKDALIVWHGGAEQKNFQRVAGTVSRLVRSTRES